MTATFTPSTASFVPDPHEHVQYWPGMILGRDELAQDFGYLRHRDHWSHRGTVGYGTMCGLRVEARVALPSVEIAVSPGTAITPPGWLVWIETEQCADLVAWCRRHAANLMSVADAANEVVLSVTLRYRHCETADVPIPGQPCRPDEEIRKPSRLRDDYELEITHERFPGDEPRPPYHAEHRATRALTAWLRTIETRTDGTGDTIDVFAARTRVYLQQLVDQSRLDRGLMTSPMVTSSPASPSLSARAVIPFDQAAIYLRTALRIWVTEFREHFREGDDGCSARYGADERLLLARVRIRMVPGSPPENSALDTSFTPVVTEVDRPILAHDAMLQELLVSSMLGGDAVPVDSGRPIGTVTLRTDGTMLTSGALTALPPPGGGLYAVQVTRSIAPGTRLIATGAPVAALGPSYVFEVLDAAGAGVHASMVSPDIVVMRLRRASDDGFTANEAGFHASVMEVAGP